MLKCLLLAGLATVALAAPAFAATDWSKVDQAMGRPGAAQADGVHRYAFPRSDLSVTLDGVALKPALALGSWAAFQPMGDEAMVMGDLVLTHEEVTPVMRKLLASGFAITALHNHLLRSTPATMYMHVGAHGDPAKLALALHDALALSHTPLAPPAPQPAAAPAPLAFDTAALDQAMGGRARQTAASISSASRAATLRWRTAWRRPRPWARQPRSTSSPPGTAKRPSPAIS